MAATYATIAAEFKRQRLAWYEQTYDGHRRNSRLTSMRDIARRHRRRIWNRRMAFTADYWQ